MNLLLVSPHFPPSNAADMHRVRLLLPYFSSLGVQVHVLAVDSEDVASPTDDWMSDNLPSEVVIHRVRALSLRWTSIPGFGILDYRSYFALKSKGDELLQREKFDLVYFSTTVFGVLTLAKKWKIKHKVPFIIDYQDPWVSDYYRLNPSITPPGGRLKYGVIDFFKRRSEPSVLKHCSGITSVSKAYPQQLASRYGGSVESINATSQNLHLPRFDVKIPCLILPFPGDQRDFDMVINSNIRQNIYSPNDGQKHWVYVGRGGEDMHLALRGIFQAIANQREAFNLVKIHFVGTSYAASGRGIKVVEPIAKEYGLNDLIQESTDRIPYAETLRCLMDADALIVPGSDDPAYTASKIYPYLLARKPLLAVFHESSSVTSLMRECKGGYIISFNSNDNSTSISNKIKNLKIFSPFGMEAVKLNEEKISSYLASKQTLNICNFFDLCLNQ